MKAYKAVLFSIDGDWVTDCEANTIEEVCELIGDMGSRWIFYPLPMIIRSYPGGTSSRQRIVSTECMNDYFVDLLSWPKGKAIKTIKKELFNNKTLQQDLVDSLNLL